MIPSGYLPVDGNVLWWLSGLLAVELALGFAVTRVGVRAETRLGARAMAWALVLVSITASERLVAQEPAGIRMLAIIAALLYGMKVVVTVESRGKSARPLTCLQWLAFACCWFGMRPQLFARPKGAPVGGAGRFAFQGVLYLLAGGASLAVARSLATWRPSLPGTWWLVTACLLLGISLAMHFGLFNLLTAAWRAAGLKCQPLFRAPWLSKDLEEFWGQRWNLAFSEMTTLAIFRPLRDRWGHAPATWAAFLFSGLLHELAISVPVQAGYGQPLSYFAIQAVGMRLETRWQHAAWRQHPWLTRTWTAGWILAPLPLLFHPPFLQGCVWPLIGL